MNYKWVKKGTASVFFLLASCVAHSAETDRIPLSAAMVVNESALGEARLIVDEQGLVASGGAAVTKWMAGWNTSSYPASIYIDLGQEYDLSSLSFYDSNSNGLVQFSVGQPSAWAVATSNTQSLYNKWVSLPFVKRTRYVRITVSVPDAVPNEIALYGKKANRPPVVSGLSPVSLELTQSASVSVTATDPDNHPVSISLKSAPAFVTLANAMPGAAQIDIKPTAVSQIGNHSVIVSAKDSLGAETLQSLSVSVADHFLKLSNERISQIAAMIPTGNSGFGAACSDRAVWDDSDLRARFVGVTAKAESLLDLPFPEWSDSLYLEYGNQSSPYYGTRQRGEEMMSKRLDWLYPLVFAECLSNEWAGPQQEGRFVPAINIALDEVARQRTWTLPSFDRGLSNFNGTAYQVDLGASQSANELAQALRLLGDRVRPETRLRVLNALEQRVFAPARASLRTGLGNTGWLDVTHNWGPVVYSNLAGAALAALPLKTDRAIFVAAAEHYSANYLTSFDADGYAAEGPMYWNYGFSHYSMMRELLHQTTAGDIDIFDNSDAAIKVKIRNIGLYGARIKMTPVGQTPPFGDSEYKLAVDDYTLRYVSKSLALGLPEPTGVIPVRAGAIVMAAMDAFPSDSALAGSAGAPVIIGRTSYFIDNGVLVSRASSPTGLSFAIKTLGNGAHSHDDIGSYVIRAAETLATGDIGKGDYSPDYFTSARSNYKLLTSYGHPVPLVAGVRQRAAAGLDNPARTCATKPCASYSPADEHRIRIDMSPAYKVSGFTALKVSRELNRISTSGNDDRIVVRDEFDFCPGIATCAPQSFETALTTRIYSTASTDKKTVFFSLQSGGAMKVLGAAIRASGSYTLVREQISELGQIFVRWAVRLDTPSKDGWVEVEFTPAQ